MKLKLTEAKRLYLSGQTLMALAVRYDCSVEWVRRCLLRAGVKMRGHGPQPKEK